MAEKSEFTIQLNDLISAAAEKAGGSLHKLTVSLGEVEKSTHHIDEATKKLEFHEVLKDAFHEVTGGISTFAAGLKDLDLGKALEGATEGAAGLAQTLDLLYPGLGQVASAAVRAAGGIAELGAGLVDTALEVTEFNEKIEATFEALGGAPGAGKPTLEFLNSMATQLPQSRKELFEWTKQYQALGVTDLGELRDQITATASAQAIMGDQGAQAYLMLQRRVTAAAEAHQPFKLATRSLQQLYQAGINVSDVAAHMGVTTAALGASLKAGTVDAVKFGDAMKQSLLEKGEKPLEAMGNEIGTLKTKLSETIGHLFDDVDTSPIIDAIKSVIDLGDQGEPSGRMLKDGMTSGINGIVAGIGHLIHEGELMFLDMEIWWLKNQKDIQTAKHDIESVAGAFGTVFHAAEKVLEVVEKIGAAIVKANPLHAIGNLMFSGENAQLDYEAKQRAGGATAALPAHASGGIVAGISGGIATVRPARGEGLASIGQGEQIIPRDAYRGMRQSFSSVANDNSQARSNTVHINHLHVEAPSGITNAHDVTVTGLAIAFERLQLASGR